MKPRRKMLWAGVTFLIIMLHAFPVLAASEQQNGKIQVELSEDWKNMKKEGIVFGCTKIGTIENGEYKILSIYESTAIDLNNLKTSTELDQASKRLEGFGVEPDWKKQTDVTGSVRFEQLEEGIYFIQAEKSPEYDVIMPTIVALPEWNEIDGKMSYEISIQPKHEAGEKTEKRVAPQTGLKTNARRCFEVGMMSFMVAGSIVVIEWRKARRNEE